MAGAIHRSTNFLETFSRGATKRRRAISCLDTPLMTFSRRLVLRSCAAATALLSLGNVCLAQSVAPAGSLRRQFETRSELDSLASAAEKAHRTGEAWLLRTRLEKGDFQEGDRIWVVVEGANIMTKPETLIVQNVKGAKVLQLPRMADLTLDGVLRSELVEKFRQHLAQYIKEPIVRATPLVRIAVLGFVGHPGYFYTAADIPLSDVIMAAGGPGANADLAKVSVRRGAEVIWDGKDTQAALADGLSIDQLHMRAGDEINVGEKHHFPWSTTLAIVVPIVTLLVTRSLYR
jgi:protein involved in polysaccharide export with SLBB domain